MGLLDRLIHKIDSAGRRNYDIIHVDTQDERGINVAFLYDKTKFEVEPDKVFFETIVNSCNLRNNAGKFKSKAAGDRLVPVGNHWPSRTGGQLESEPYRLIAGETLAYFNQRIQEVHGGETSIS
ncbi:MAG: hypothetical protein ACJ70W_06660 [Nitrososphaera sp.]